MRRAFGALLLLAGMALPASAADGDSPETVVRAVYDTISGPAGPRDWARFRLLFAAGARLITIRATPEGTSPSVMTDKTRTPWNKTENVSLAKTFQIRERMHLTFRAEAFNLLNRVVFGSPDSTFSSGTFEQIRSQANSPRQMQGALKLVF